MLNKRSTITRKTALRLLAAAGACALAPLPALADPEGDLATTEASLAEAQVRLEEAQAQLDAIASEYEALSREQSVMLDELDDVRTQVAHVSDRVERLGRSLASKQDELARSVAEEYKDGSHGVVDIVLGSRSIDDLISNFYYYNKVVEEKSRLIEDVKATKADLVAQQTELEAQQVSLEEISQLQAEQLEAMRGKQLEAQQVIEGLDEEVRALIVQRDAEILAAQQEAERARQEREEAERLAAEQAAAAQAAEVTQVEAPQPVAEPGQDAEPVSEAEPEPEPEPVIEPVAEEVTESIPGVGSAAAVISSCMSTPSPGAGLCAGWCSNVMENAGYGYVPGNANDMYASYCFSSNRADLMPGMAVAVSTHPHTTAGRIYGHIGMYIGGGMMMDNIGYIRTISVDEWCAYYGETVSPRWGWLNGIVLQ